MNPPPGFGAMSISRTRNGHPTALWSICLGAALGLVATVVGQPFGVTAGDSSGPEVADSSGTIFEMAAESPTCATINSNSSLVNSYTGFYYSLANNSPSFWQGGINH